MVIARPQFETETRILGISATFILATCIMGLILMTLLFLNTLAWLLFTELLVSKKSCLFTKN